MIHGSDAYQGMLSLRIEELEATCVRWAKQVDELEAERDSLKAKSDGWRKAWVAAAKESDRLEAEVRSLLQADALKLARFQELEAERDHYKAQAMQLDEQIQEVAAERDRLRVALTNIRTHDYDNDHVDICFHQIMLEVDQALNP